MRGVRVTLLPLVFAGACAACAARPPKVGLAAVRAPNAALPEADPAAPSASKHAARVASLDRHVLFRFRAGTPMMAEPAVGPDGSIYLATVDGYVHALYPDGRFHWSYTLAGGVLGAPVVDRRGTLYVGTESGRIYVIHPNGTGFWTFQAPTSIVTPLVRDAHGLVLFGASDQRVFAVSPFGGALWSVLPGGAISAGPVAGPHARLWFGTESGALASVGGYSQLRVTELGGPILSAPVVGEDGSVFAVAGDRLVALGPDRKERWHADGVRFVSRAGGGDVVVCLGGGDLAWMRGSGATLRRVHLAERASAPPAVLPDGRVVVPTDSGRVLLVSASGKLSGAERVGHAPLLAPLVDAARERVLVTSGDGQLVVLSIEK
jgi:outer membrane protein assembly factor BamB